MNVAYHSSDAYSQMLGVSITSLLENNKGIDDITVYVIERDVSENNKEKLKTLVDKYSRNIVFIAMPDINRQENLGLVKIKKKWIFDSYCRLFLDKLLPEKVDRVLYLDSDVLVMDSLQELWNMDMQGHCAGGVSDCISKRYFTTLGLSDKTFYCNSGVILYDLKLWKQMQMDRAIKKFIASQNGYVFFMEQTVLNAVMDGKWLLLDAKYNVSTLMLALTYEEINLLREPYHFYSSEEVAVAVHSPCLIHMTSVFIVNNRAWVEGSNHPAVANYQKYKAISPWAHEADFPDNRTLPARFVDFMVKILPKKFILTFVSFIYNTVRINRIEAEMKRRK